MRYLTHFLILMFGLIAIAYIISGCGAKYVTTDYVGYDNKLDGDYKSKHTMVNEYEKVKTCMGIGDAVPYPSIRIYGCEVYENCKVNGVPCTGFAKPVKGCYETGIKTVVVPVNTDNNLIQHEFVHYLCDMNPGYCVAGDRPDDPQHLSKWFLKCSGLMFEK
jgi:hypothetical protein